MPTKINRYRRTYHNSDSTKEVLDRLPEWMYIHDENSIGFQLVNGLYGVHAEHMTESIRDMKNNFFASTANHNEPQKIWKTQHDTASGNIPPEVTIYGKIDTSVHHSIPSGTIEVDSSTVTPIYVDNEESFFAAPPTRLVYDPSDDVTPGGTDNDITGITFVKGWSKVDSSGVVQIPAQDVYIVNRSVQYPNPDSTIVYDTDWNTLDTYDHSVGTQDYSNTYRYELITDPSGTRLEYNPVASTVAVYDYLNLDTQGNSQVISDEYWNLNDYTSGYVTWTVISMSGTNPYNYRPIEHSNYYVEYTYLKHEYPKQVTTPHARWGIQTPSNPIFTASPVNYNGTVLNTEMADSVSGGSVALRVRPDALRPGATADIKFNYVASTDVSWDHGTTFTYDLTTDSNFERATSGAVRIYHGGEDITSYFDIQLDGRTVVSIPTIDEPPHSAPFTVRVYYEATKTYENVTGVQSISSDSSTANPYPNDYYLDNGYAHPYTILPITESDSSIRLYLGAAGVDKFEVVTDLVFSGIAYDEDKDCYWMLEKNGVMLYKIRPSDGSIMGKWPIFKSPNFYANAYKSRASVTIDPAKDESENYPFIDYTKDISTRSVEGCVYKDDFLYIISDASATGVSATGVLPTESQVDTINIPGTGIYRLDTYNDRVNDIEWDTDGTEVYPHFPYPEGITNLNDIAINNDGDFIVSYSGGIHKLQVEHDYTLIDSQEGVTRGTVYYRANYPSGVIVDGFDDWRE